jgi:hypothetical protein
MSYGSVVASVAAAAEVPADWIVLQERHVALGTQVALFDQLAPEDRAGLLERVYGRPAAAGVEDAVATQGELRARLMKAGCPCFVEETSIAFREGLDFILELDAIPVYPTLADGVLPICGFEDPVSALIERIEGHGIHGAELIPVRNRPAVVDEYVKAFRAAGIFVLVGTEHNTQERIPVAPTCLGGVPLSEDVARITWEGTCVVAAHQQRRRDGEAGFVDGRGRPNPTFPDAETRIRWFAELGEELLLEAAGVAR